MNLNLRASRLIGEAQLRLRQGLFIEAALRFAKSVPSTAVGLGLSMLLAACGGGASSPAMEVKTATSEVIEPVAATASAASSTASAKELITSRLNAKKALAAAAPANAVTAFNGWYWNPAESGTGFMFEVQGSRGFVAFFMYEEGTGKPVWYSADGAFSANSDGSYSFSGDLRYYTKGQPVSSPTYLGPSSVSAGAVQMRFTGANVAVQLPGRTIAATRFNFNGLGSTDSATPAQPEVGWYWNPAEGGRGYAIEVQNNRLFLAMFHYNEDGTPTWNVMQGDMISGVATYAFQLYSGGQSMTSAYRSPELVDLGSYTLSFRNRCAGQVQRAGTPAVSIRRYFFGDITPGAECHTVADGIPDVAGLTAGPVQMQPGDAVFGNIDFGGDIDAFGIALQANTTYQFDLKGYTTNNGSLWDPMLTLYNAQLTKVAENDDGTDDLDAHIVFTPTASGTYYLAASAFQQLTGSFVLTASGVAQGLSAQPAPALATYAGAFGGSYVGKARGSIILKIDSLGTVTGTLTANGQKTPLSLSGSVAFGGVVRLSGFTDTGTLTLLGYLGPQGDLAGTWFDQTGPGGTFTAVRGGS